MTYPKAGSANEMLNEQGAALVNKCLAFNSGSGLSTIMIMRNIEDDGGIPFSKCGKFGATLGFTCPPENAAHLAPLLATDCSFERWDVRDALKLAKIEAEVAQSSAQVVLTEHLYAGAFGPQSLAGRPYFSPSSVGLAEIQSFRSRAYGVNGAVLAVTGVTDHAAFVKQIEEGFAGSPAGSSDSTAALAYLGGESRLSVLGGAYAHVALAFDGTACSAALLSVVKHCFQVTGAASGVTAFSTKGLVGVYAGGAASGELVDTLCKAVTDAGPGSVKRAKVLAKAEALFALDDGSQGLAEAMTSSVLESGTFTGAAGIIAAYDAITEKDVEAALSAMLKKTPTLAAIGDITSVPYLGSVMSRFS
jgi:predicted Zn-dependent peptidase